MHVQVAIGEARRHRLARAEVHHVERAEGDDLRHSHRTRRLQAMRPGREDAADELVRELRRGGVEHAGEVAGACQRLHRLAAGAGRVEHEHLVAELLEALARGRHAGRRDAEHAGADQPLLGSEIGHPRRAAPAIMAAAFVMIRAEIRLIPAMSTTEYIIAMSTEPMYGRVSPDATVETSSFGTPTGSARMAWAMIVELPEPPSPRMPSSLPSACSRSTTSAAPRSHRVDRRAAVVGRDERGDLHPGGRGDLVAADVRRRERLAEDAGVEQQHLDTVLAHAIAQNSYS